MIVAPRNTEPFGPLLPEPTPPVKKTVAKKGPRADRNRAEIARDNSVAKLLSRDQVKALVIIAKQAWESVRLVRDDVGKSFDAWRHLESIKACESRISEATQDKFSRIKSHFLNLAGNAGGAFKSAMRSETEAERIALAKLEEECSKRNLPMSYPAAIALRQFKKTNLADCSAKQIWCLVFTVKNRRAETPAAVPQATATGKTKTYTLKHNLSNIPPADSVADEEDPF